MATKLIRFQFIFFLALSIFNITYFYFEDSLPDHLYSISSAATHYNFLTYYLTSFLVLLSSYSGPWTILALIVYCFVYSIYLLPNQTYFAFIVGALLWPALMTLCYLTVPNIIGEALQYYLHRIFLNWHLICFISLWPVVFIFYLKSYPQGEEALERFLNACTVLLSLAKRVFIQLALKLKFQIANRISSRKSENPSAKIHLLSAYWEKSLQIFRRKEKKSHLLQFNQETPKESSVSSMTFSTSSTTFLERSQFLDTKIDVQSSNETGDHEISSISDVSNVTVNLSKDHLAATVQLKYRPKGPSRVIKYAGMALIECFNQDSKKQRRPIVSEEYFQTIIQCLEEKFKEFKINGTIINVLKGPVVDTFEVELGAGVKVSKVTAVTEDLGLALCGALIRIIYPMKGKTTIGIEVPRNPREVIFLDEILNSAVYESAQQILPLALGKNAFGEVKVVDLVSMPHMLVAGSTGAGKSVFINTILVSLLIKKSPQEMKLFLIDPKQLELALYASLPHLLLPVITDADTAAYSLTWLCQEMERRYSILKELSVRNVESFNEKVGDSGAEELHKIAHFYSESEEDGFKLPYIVVIVDEFADLILSKKGKEIEYNICRLAAKARAAGIHLIIATQRPSVDVITGLIKANFPTRVSFKVTSSIDSRTILNSIGAERLLGKGDMLFKHGIEVERLHSSFVDDPIVEKFSDQLSGQGTEFNQGALAFIKESNVNDPQQDILVYPQERVISGTQHANDLTLARTEMILQDELYGEAVKVVQEVKMASASMLQRKLKIGYNRAANLVDLLENKGIIGPQQGSRPREVFFSSED